MENLIWIIPIAVVAIGLVLWFIKGKRDAMQWLVYAVAQAESYLGSGTGELKLSEVYGAFMKQFPALSRFITFNTFKKMVDIALKQLKELAEEKADIADFIGKE